ncbi:PmoA family protein [Bacteroides sp. 224]|uniref:DUF6807 domain-containing protein n=1 Tax=Bacteroides sp. 224 TaxID=2302936 RepID=UPI0013D14D35|nr:PmoA family protein [Bacteroides sp. 224]NDV65237.1 hypothetical protein [Bacteroides sp. 224]
MKTYILFFIALFLVSCELTTSSDILIDNGHSLKFERDGKRLFTYNYGMTYPPTSIDSVYKRSGFFHPIKSLNGETLTNLSPSDHYHHYGLWYAWTKTTFDGKEIDFWNVAKKQGTVRFREFTDRSTQGFSAILDHVAYPDSQNEQIAMIENLKIEIGNSSIPGYYLDYITTLKCATEKPITLECYRYGGLVIRTREDWTPGRADFKTSEGFTQKDADNTDARWAFYQGKGDHSNACILILSHPSNLNHPEPLRIWDEKANSGKGDMMWNFSPTKKQAYTLRPESELKLRYRIYILDELIDSKKAERLWKRFGKED